jgi:subtilisin family serine protease
MSVASTDSSGVRSSFSNYGSTVDIAAPGFEHHLDLRLESTSYAT